MLSRLKKFLPKARRANKALIIPREDHSISRRDISQGALKIMRRLNDAGHEGYLVGGGVRDLLLGGAPKDFDIATDATPEQVKHLFRGSRIIGRRFRIVHVRMGREIIEVTTFRAHHDSVDQNSSTHKRQASRSDQGMLLRDNVYGDLKSDAARRDFTINALYYTIDGFAIHDYAGGVKDIERRVIRMIGDPATRYQEDPVRMLRAVRFAAKLGFAIEPETAKPIPELAEMLGHVPAARLFEEVLKLFMAGSATATFHQLRDFGLLAYLFPGTDACLRDGDLLGQRLIEQAMLNTDKRIRNKLRVTPAFIYAALLWPVVVKIQAKLEARGMSAQDAAQQAAQEAVSQQLQHTSLPKRFLIPMREIWDLQARLPRRQGKRAERLLEHPRFRAAYDFVLLREEAGEDLDSLGNWWTRYQDGDDDQRRELVAGLERNDKPGGGKPRRRRRRKKPADAGAPPTS